MKQADKDLLLKDLCARLPYGVKVRTSVGGEIRNDKVQLNFAQLSLFEADHEDVKPYLFPLSSMTEAQRKELEELHFGYISDEIFNDIEFVYHYDCMHLIDWCYKNNLDINGLIPRGLAYDATGLNIY